MNDKPEARPAAIVFPGSVQRQNGLKISVVGRKSGRTISIPVWFVLEGDKLYLLLVQGSDTQWYKNVFQNQQIRLEARGGAAFERVPFGIGLNTTRFTTGCFGCFAELVF